MDTPVAGDYTHVETNVRVSVISQRAFRFLAEREAERRKPREFKISGVDCGAFYHLRIEKTGPFRHEIVAYQNVLYPNDALPECTCGTDCGCLCPRHDTLADA